MGTHWGPGDDLQEDFYCVLRRSIISFRLGPHTVLLLLHCYYLPYPQQSGSVHLEAKLEGGAAVGEAFTGVGCIT